MIRLTEEEISVGVGGIGPNVDDLDIQWQERKFVQDSGGFVDDGNIPQGGCRLPLDRRAAKEMKGANQAVLQDLNLPGCFCIFTCFTF